MKNINYFVNLKWLHLLDIGMELKGHGSDVYLLFWNYELWELFSDILYLLKVALWGVETLIKQRCNIYYATYTYFVIKNMFDLDTHW